MVLSTWLNWSQIAQNPFPIGFLIFGQKKNWDLDAGSEVAPRLPKGQCR